MTYLEMAKNVLKAESEAILKVIPRLTDVSINQLVTVYNSLLVSNGSLIFSGVGKSGIIAQKLASTFSSLGLHSYYLHPVEAMHGDLGKIRDYDAFVFISKSGATDELMRLFPFLPLPKERVIGLLGKVHSPLAEKAGVIFDCSVEREACVHNQAPTTSSTVALAVGDALAVVYENFIGLSKEHFAINHPGGPLGKALRLLVKDLMIPQSRCPSLSQNARLKDAVLKLTENPVGLCVILEGNKLLGIIVDGDIRRAFGQLKDQNETQILNCPIHQLMNRTPISIGESELAYHALELMEKRKTQITALPVVNDGEFLGIIRLHDLIREGLF